MVTVVAYVIYSLVLKFCRDQLRDQIHARDLKLKIYFSSFFKLRKVDNIFWMVVGLEILAFPCNQFLKQEPGTSEEAEQFACTRYKAEYPIFQKVIGVFFAII